MIGNEARISAFTLISQHCAGESSQYNNTGTAKEMKYTQAGKKEKKNLFLCDTLIYNKMPNNLQNNTLELVSLTRSKNTMSISKNQIKY